MKETKMNFHLSSGKTVQMTGAQVMGIINVTPDSFYAQSRVDGSEELEQRVRRMVADGATMIDVGAYSTRPDAAEVTAEEELRRLAAALPVVRKAAPEAIISVDTFRASVAEACVLQYGADVINDVSGGTLDEAMLPTVARLQVPYILMHMRGTPKTMQQLTDYPDGVTAEVVRFMKRQTERLQELGYQGDLVLDPGFGFAKTLEQNYELYAHIQDLKQLGYPVLVGISRKSMIYRLLGTTPQEALNGTSVLNTIALMQGADILRVHDVREAVECVKICSALG